MSADKTNVMRILDQKKIKYKVHEYKDSGAVSGVEVAAALGQDPKRAFKTLVTIGKSGNHYVFMVPVDADGQAALWVSIYQQNFFAFGCKSNAQIFTGGGLAGAAFLVDDGNRSCFL